MKMDYSSRNKDPETTQKQIPQTMQSDRFAARGDGARSGEQTYDGSRGEGAWSTGAKAAKARQSGGSTSFTIPNLTKHKGNSNRQKPSSFLAKGLWMFGVCKNLHP
jgi:hypothetical protein